MKGYLCTKKNQKKNQVHFNVNKKHEPTEKCFHKTGSLTNLQSLVQIPCLNHHHGLGGGLV